jgi:tetratricopeptide (TPR) repeat protein
VKATKQIANRAAAKKSAKPSASNERGKSAAKSVPAKTTTAKKSSKAKPQAAVPAKKQPPIAAKTKSTAKSRPTRTATPSRKAPAETHAMPMQLVRQPTRDEAAALQAFERAHKEFARGRFTEAAAQFRSIVERFSVAEVTARARTYLTVAEARQRSEQAPPETADALYDRGVLELNRANYIGAQELFERALGRDASPSHIHYALAVTRARLGSRQPAFEALERALELQPNLRARAMQDTDLSSLRNDAEFERIVFSSRS